MKKRIYIFTFLVLLVLETGAQVSLKYQKPSQEILELVDVSLAPSVLVNDSKDFMILLYRDPIKSIEDLSLQANHFFLKSLANNFDGKLYYPNELNKLVDFLNNR